MKKVSKVKRQKVSFPALVILPEDDARSEACCLDTFQHGVSWHMAYRRAKAQQSCRERQLLQSLCEISRLRAIMRRAMKEVIDRGSDAS